MHRKVGWIVLIALVSVALALAPQSAYAARPTGQPFNILPLTINSVTVQNGGLIANGSLGSHAFTSPITLAATPSAGTCPILDLHLDAIHLNLLGLNVDTSDICLSITAISGTDNLLGNLLCSVAGLLNQGVPLSTILGGLSAGDLGALTSGLTNILNGVLGSVTSSSAVAGASCNILNLALGPVDLTLLGLNVHLDNCSNGPVTVDITAQPGALLGDLLCNLANLLNNSNASARAIEVHLQQIAQAILALI
jgi:hypothetical protein